MTLQEEENYYIKKIDDWLTLCEESGFLAKFKELRNEIKELNIKRFLDQNSDGSSKTLEEELKWEVDLQNEHYDLSNEQQLKDFKSKLEEIKSGEKSEEKDTKLQRLWGDIINVSIKEESPWGPVPTQRRFEAIEGLLNFNVKGKITINEDNVKALAGEYQLKFLNDASQDRILVGYLIKRKILTKLLEWEPTDIPHYPLENNEERKINELTQNLIRWLEQLPNEFGSILVAQLRRKIFGWLAPNTYPKEHLTVTKKAKEIEEMCEKYASLKEKGGFEKKIQNLTSRIWREFYFYLKALPTTSTWEFLDGKTIKDFRNDVWIRGIENEEEELADDNPIFCWFPLVKRPTDQEPIGIRRAACTIIDLNKVKKIDASMTIEKNTTAQDLTESNQKTSQTPVLDESEAINISENQAPEPSTSTGITNTKNPADNNLVPQTEPLPAENTLQNPETDLSEYENLWQLIKNSTQLEELKREELKDESIDRLKLVQWNEKQNLKYIHNLKKELLTRELTDEELTNELQERGENLQPESENDWYCLFKSQGSNEIRRKDKIQRIIKELTETKAWVKFFAEKGITDLAHQAKWKQTGLSPTILSREGLSQTERAWNNGWHDYLIDPNISSENSRNGEIDWPYQVIKEGIIEEDSLNIKLFLVDYSDIKTFSNLIERINNANNLNIEDIREESNKIKNYLIKIRMTTIIKNKTEEIWKRFFSLHPEIDTDIKKLAWKKSELNPVESSPGEADSEADVAWGNGWTDLILTGLTTIDIAPSDGVGKIEIMNDKKVKYTSYGGEYIFDSLYKLLIEYRKDDIDKEWFWNSFENNYERWWNIYKLADDKLVDNEENKEKAEKWRQKGYLPSDASRYQSNRWEPDKAAAKNDPSHSDQAEYEGNWYDMEQRKLDIEKASKTENNEAWSESNTTHHTAELRGQARKEGTDNKEEEEIQQNVLKLSLTITALTIADPENSEPLVPYDLGGSERNKTTDESKEIVKPPSSQANINDNQRETPLIWETEDNPTIVEKGSETYRESLNKKEWIKKEIEKIKEKIINNAKKGLVIIDNENTWRTSWGRKKYTIPQLIEQVIQNENDKEELKRIFEATRTEVMQEIRKNRHEKINTEHPSSEKRSWGEIVTRGAIVLIVVGVIGVGIKKWLSNHRKAKISEYTEIEINLG